MPSNREVRFTTIRCAVPTQFGYDGYEELLVTPNMDKATVQWLSMFSWM